MIEASDFEPQQIIHASDPIIINNIMKTFQADLG